MSDSWESKEVRDKVSL